MIQVSPLNICCFDSRLGYLAHCYEAVPQGWEGEHCHVAVKILDWEQRKLREERSLSNGLHCAVKGACSPCL